MERLPVDLALIKIRALRQVDNVVDFACGDQDLDEFLCYDALRLQALNVVRVYLAFHDDDLAGYVALLNDVVVLASAGIWCDLPSISVAVTQMRSAAGY